MSGKGMSKAVAKVDNTSRRTWDREEFRQKAEEREKKEVEKEESALDVRRRKRLERDPLHQGLIVARSELKARDYQLDLGSRLGKTQVIGFNTPLNQQAGFYCSVCDCVLRDSQSYLDHINGKWHNRALGMTMRVEKSTVEQVKTRMEELKKQREGADGTDYVPDGFEKPRIIAPNDEEAQGSKRKKKGSQAKEATVEDADPEMMALMGFGGFGSSAKR